MFRTLWKKVSAKAPVAAPPKRETRLMLEPLEDRALPSTWSSWTPSTPRITQTAVNVNAQVALQKIDIDQSNSNHGTFVGAQTNTATAVNVAVFAPHVITSVTLFGLPTA